MASDKFHIIFNMLTITTLLCSSTSYSATNIIQRGFIINPKSTSSYNFQSILTDQTSNFSLVFLQVESKYLDLAIIHLPSSFPVWRATPNHLASWSTSTALTFNGSLLLSDSKTGVVWSTKSTMIGDKLVLLNSSNLQITKSGKLDSVLWQSFDFPSDTILQNQNFTSNSSLFSANQKYSMSLGFNFMALYVENLGVARPMYWRRTALQAKAQIVQGKGPIYARLDPTGFLGVYQNEEAPADIMPFDTFNGGVKIDLRRLTLENDGNLKAYYWSGSNWVSDFVAVHETCDLPNPCGSYGLCHVNGQTCAGCLGGNQTDGGCFGADAGDLCGSGNGYRVLRRVGVGLVNDEWLGFEKVGSLGDCEKLCESKCECWGAVYNNGSGYCYRVDYPIQTIVAVDDGSRFGYFKVRNEVKGDDGRKKVGLVILLVGALALAGGCGYIGYRVLNGKMWRNSEDHEDAVMPYKDLNSSSFRSVEMSSSFRK